MLALPIEGIVIVGVGARVARAPARVAVVIAVVVVAVVVVAVIVVAVVVVVAEIVVRAVVVAVTVGVVGVVEAPVGTRVAITGAIGIAVRVALAVFVAVPVDGVVAPAAALRECGVHCSPGHQDGGRNYQELSHVSFPLSDRCRGRSSKWDNFELQCAGIACRRLTHRCASF